MQVDKQLEGKVELITGAGSGIGRATALMMAKAGAKIGALANEAGEVKSVVADIKRSGGDAIPIVADVARDDQMHKAVYEPVDKWGRLDIVFANAGINGVWAPLEELKAEDWDNTLQTNLKFLKGYSPDTRQTRQCGRRGTTRAISSSVAARHISGSEVWIDGAGSLLHG